MNKFIFIFISFLCFLYSEILTGLDVFEEEEFRLIQNKKIGLVINHTSLNKDNIHILDLLLKHSQINIKYIFTPEHGLKGNFSAGESVLDTFDKSNGVEIISLYGKQKKPNLEHIENLDCIVFDIQDIGSRYYTYLSTLTYILDAAARADIPVIVLDRPNPLGRDVKGPIISLDFYSFVGMHPIPIRHGMTIGELALMINGENWLESKKTANLKVIKLEGWNTEPGYFSIPPSPNIPDFPTALMYNGMCLFEGTNISEGRGTNTPFLLFGSPWMDSKNILRDLVVANLPGVKFYLKTFKPLSIEGAKYPKYKNKLCYGIKIDIVDQFEVNPIETSISILKIIYNNHSDKFSFNNNDFIANLYGDDKIKKNIFNKQPIDELMMDWIKDSKYFRAKREPYLLY